MGLLDFLDLGLGRSDLGSQCRLFTLGIGDLGLQCRALIFKGTCLGRCATQGIAKLVRLGIGMRFHACQ